jgi:N-acetylneuraminic acid mutarotase
MTYYPEAVVIEGNVYVGGGSGSVSGSGTSDETVMVYSIEQDEWNSLPPYQVYWFGMTSLHDQLVLVGGTGGIADERTDLLGVWKKESQKWTHPFPPMNVARSGPAVVTYNERWIVVVGGFDGRSALESVEILDVVAGKWFHGASMPLSHEQYKLSTAVIGNMLYLMDGFGYTERVLCASLDDLVTTASLSATPTQPLVWNLLPTIFSLEGSTATSLQGALVVLGGGHSHKCLYAYQPSSKSWIKAGEMPIERHQCACAILPSGELFVVGGYTREVTSCCEVHIGKPRVV